MDLRPAMWRDAGVESSAMFDMLLTFLSTHIVLHSNNRIILFVAGVDKQ